MAAIKKDHTLSGRWQGMMDDYLKVWQVLHRWGSSHSPPPHPLSLSFPHLAYLGQCFNTPLALRYWHTPDSICWLMSIWEPLSPSFLFTFFHYSSLDSIRFSPLESPPCTPACTATCSEREHTCKGWHFNLSWFLLVIYSKSWSGWQEIESNRTFHWNLQNYTLLLSSEVMENECYSDQEVCSVFSVWPAEE